MIKNTLRHFIKYIPFFLLIITGLILGIGAFFFIFQFGISNPLLRLSSEVHHDFTFALKDMVFNVSLTDITGGKYLKDGVIKLFTLLDSLELNEVRKISFFTLLAIAALLGAIKLGEVISKMIIGKNLINRTSKTGIIASIIKGIISLLFWLAFFIISYYWIFAVFLLPIISIVLDGVKDLITVWYLHFRNYKISNFINRRNALTLLGIRVVVNLVIGALFVATSQLLSIFVALFIAISLLAYSSVVISMTSLSYFNQLRSEKQLKID